LSQIDLQNKTIWTGCRIETPVLINGAASLIAIAIAAYRVNKLVAVMAALAFAASIVVSGFSSRTKATGSSDAGAADAHREASLFVLRKTTCLSFLTCAWSAAALFLAYPIAGLSWLHGWEYGMAYALIAVGFGIYAKRLSDDHNPATAPDAIARAGQLATLQAVAIIVTLVWMIASRKLATLRGDWLANDVFLASGCAIFALSVLFITHLRAARKSS
jgi:hypothetical protein